VLCKLNDDDGEEIFDCDAFYQRLAGCSQEAEQNRLEVEMQKRRERIEQWRAARKAKQEDATPVQAAPASRKWTLEDEEDEDAENDVAAAQNGENEDVDPLDAYMQVTFLLL